MEISLPNPFILPKVVFGIAGTGDTAKHHCAFEIQLNDDLGALTPM